MFFLKLNKNIVTDLTIVSVNLLKCHELVVNDRKDALKIYLKSLGANLIVPSIIVCNKTNTIIDGHHRFAALVELGFMLVPVTYINYFSEAILACDDQSIKKDEIINASLTGKLLPPKSSKHLIFDINSKTYKPILMISSLYLM